MTTMKDAQSSFLAVALAECAQRLESALSGGEHSADAMGLLALARYMSDEKEKAEEWASKACSVDPKCLSATVVLLQLYRLQRPRWQLTADSLLRQLRWTETMVVDDQFMLTLLAMAHLALHQTDLAIRRATEASGESSLMAFVVRAFALLEQGKSGPAAEDFAAVTKRVPSFARGWVGLGVARSRVGDRDGARRCWDEALRANTRCMLAHLNRGISLAKEARASAAMEELTEAILLDPTPEAYSARGCVRLTLGEVERALEDFDDAIWLDPGSAITRCNRGIAHARLERFNRSLSDYSFSLNADPGLWQANLGKALVLSRRQQLEAAITAFSAVLALRPDHSTGLLGRSLCLLHRRRHLPALADLQRLLSMVPAPPETTAALLNRSAVRLAMSETAAAIEDINTAFRMGTPPPPMRAALHFNRGCARRMAGDLAGAKAEFERAIELDPNDSEAINNLGACLIDSGRGSEAGEKFRRAVSIRASDHNFEAENNVEYVRRVLDSTPLVKVPPTRMGYLVKRGHRIRSWRRRFFVLEPGQLLYYDDESRSKLKGALSLGRGMTVRDMSGPATGRQNCFEIACGGKSLVMAATSAAEMREWIAAFEEHGILRSGVS